MTQKEEKEREEEGRERVCELSHVCFLFSVVRRRGETQLRRDFCAFLITVKKRIYMSTKTPPERKEKDEQKRKTISNTIPNRHKQQRQKYRILRKTCQKNRPCRTRDTSCFQLEKKK